MIATKDLIRQNNRYAKLRWGGLLGRIALRALRNFTEQFQFSVANGDLLFLDSGWYVTHSGLTSLARRNRCAGIKVQPVQPFCEPSAQRWAFEATVYKSKTCRGFAGYGDADPSNVSCPRSRLRKCELPKHEPSTEPCARPTASVICSVEEIGAIRGPAPTEKLPPAEHEWQWQQRRSQSPRPSLPNHPPAQARSRTRKGLRRRLLRHEDAQRGQPRTG
jgi:hypothetical protein